MDAHTVCVHVWIRGREYLKTFNLNYLKSTGRGPEGYKQNTHTHTHARAHAHTHTHTHTHTGRDD